MGDDPNHAQGLLIGDQRHHERFDDGGGVAADVGPVALGIGVELGRSLLQTKTAGTVVVGDAVVLLVGQLPGDRGAVL